MQEKFPVFLLVAAGLLGLSGASRNEHQVSEQLGQSFLGGLQARAQSSPVTRAVFSVAEDDPAEVTFPFQTLAADPARGAAASFGAARAERAEKGTDRLLEESSRSSDMSEQSEGAMLNAQTSGFFTSMSSPFPRQKTESWVVQDPNEPLLGKAARGEHVPASRPGTASTSTVQSHPSGPRAAQPLRSAFAGSVPPEGIQETAVPSARASPVTRAVNSHVLVQSPKEPSVPAVNATQAPAGLGGDRFPALGPSSDRLGESSPQVRLNLASVTLAAPKETPGPGARVTPVPFLRKPVSGGLAAIVSRAKQLAPVGLSPPKRATTESQTTLPATSELSTPRSPDGLAELLAPPPGDAPPSFIPGPPEVPAPQASSQSLHKLRSRTDEPQLTSVTRPVPLGELGLSTAGRKSRVERPTLALPRGIGHQTSARGPEPARSPESSEAAAGRPSPLTRPQARALLSQPAAAGRAGTSPTSPRQGQLSSATLVPMGSPPLNSADSPRPPGTTAPAHVGLPAPLPSASTAPGLTLLGDPDETAKPLAQGLLNNSRNLSAFLAEHLLLPASAQYLTFLIRSVDDALCLHPMPNTPPLTADLNATLQEALLSSSALLSSTLDPASLKQLSPSSIVLVKPLFVLLPADKPALSILPASAEEDRLATAFSFASQQDRGPATPSTGHGIPKETSSPSSTREAPGAATALSPAPDQLQRQAAFSTSTRAISLFGSQTFTSKHVPYPLGELGMTAPPENQPEGAALPAAPTPEENETGSLVPRGAFAEHRGVAPPALSLPTLHSPQMSTETLPVAAKLSSPTIISLLPAKGFSGSPSPTSAPHTESRVTGWLQLISKLTLQSRHPHLGSVTTSALVKQRLASSVGSTNLLPEAHASLAPLLSTESLGKPPSQTESIPSPVLPSSALSAGRNRTGLAAGDDTPSEEVTARHAATPTPAASTKADLSKPAGFLPIPPNPFRMTEKPDLTSGPGSFSTESQTNATVSGTPLGTRTQTPRQSRSSVGMSLYASTSVPSSSTLISNLASLEVAGGLSSLVNLGEEAKPTESVVVIGSARREGSKELISLPAEPGPETQLSTAVTLGLKLVPASAQPPLSARPTTLQQDRELASGSVHPPSSRSPFAVINDQVTALLTSRKASLPMTSSSRSDLLPAVTTSNEATTASPSPGEARSRPVTGGGVTAGQLPGQAPVSPLPELPSRRPSRLPERASLEEAGKLLGRFDLSTRLAQSTASAARVGTSTSVATQLASTSDRLIEKTVRQFSVSNAAVSDGLETLLTTDLSQFQPTPETLSDPSEVPMVFTSERSRLLDVTHLESSERPALHTQAEQVARISDMTEDTAGDLATAPAWLEAEPVALENRARQRSAGQLDDALLDGFAVVSDDTCGSGNYTARMSVRPAAETALGAHVPLSSPESFLAVIALQSNSSRPALRIRACCVTPTSRTPGPEAACCLFPRADFEAGKPHGVAAAGSETTFPIHTRVPFDCRHIQSLHDGQSRAASFTIQLFQMLNHSVAYLHCELNICLSSSPGCEQNCLEGTEAASQPGSRSSSSGPHNLVSVGPVRKVKSAFPSEQEEGPASIMIVPILLGSLTGLAILGSVFVCLWLHHRRKTPSPGDPFLRATSGL